ncbi:putative cyclase-domain-containing protein [Dactylonectria macrodidyma]|uniref:Cyclase-domain-containing protein n=1 Tax=Dactylonectria macrodidyma TaxID=307937 RepID=A0A9P9FNU4_9HYPO|nr:putative cyclase-domain-containing protein [Dactylonectria macrodidyma]
MEATSTLALPKRPLFDDLPLRPGDPKSSAWGLWGEDDELGTLNLLTPEVVKRAAAEVMTGKTIPLNLPLNAFGQPMNPVRKPCTHRIIAKGHANDDELDINTQGSSHWDGPRHYPYQETLQYYNGLTQDDISGPAMSNKLGIQNLAIKTITGRGVLLDWFSWAQKNNIDVDPFSQHGIPLSDLLAVAKAQNTQFRPGDILIVRTGWLRGYRDLTREAQDALAHRPVRSSCGIDASPEVVRWHWDNAFAAVASDTVAYEVWPSPRSAGDRMHEVFLSGWGMPIGESFDLEKLAETCREEERWSFMFVSVPLDVPGGIASPPGAVAIF